MPATTGSPYNLPYPLLGESPNGPVQLQSLAEAIAAAITTTSNATALNAANALSAAVATIGVTTGSLQASVTALNALNIGPQLAAVTSDTGWQSAGFANQSGWGATLYRYRIFMGKIVFIEIDSTRTGGTISADSQGHFSQANVISIPAVCRPYASWYGIYHAEDTSGTFTVTSAGIVGVRDAHSNSDIDSGDSCRFRATYVKVG